MYLTNPNGSSIIGDKRRPRPFLVSAPSPAEPLTSQTVCNHGFIYNPAYSYLLFQPLLQNESIQTPSKMRAIQVEKYLSGPQDMTVTTLPDPTPQSNQYLIQIHATATNFFDLLQIRGKYQHVSPSPTSNPLLEKPT